jgi:uncharacterized membrane protein
VSGQRGHTGPPPAAAPRGAAPHHAAPRLDAAAIEAVIARLLVAGTYLAMALILLGVAGMLSSSIDPMRHATPPPFDLAAIPRDVLAGRPEGFLWLGIGLVIALPVGRVIVAGIGFLGTRDRRLALVSLGVLLVVTLSVFAALGLGD